MEHDDYIRALMRQYYKESGKLFAEEDTFSIIQAAVVFAIAKFDASRNVKLSTFIHSVVRNTIRSIYEKESYADEFVYEEDFDPAVNGDQEDFEFINDMTEILSPEEMSIFWLVQADMTRQEMYELGHTRHEVEKCFEGIKAKYLSLGKNQKISMLKKKQPKQDSSLQKSPSKQSKNIYLVANQ